MTKIAVILSGCGVFDGAEIHESVVSLLAIERNDATWHCFAPDVNQHHVVNHLSGEEADQTRNVLVESARIARGNVKNVNELKAEDFDALLLPGGFGAAKNLCNFAFKGADCEANADVLRACKDFAEAGKPAGYVCIAPMLLPLVYGKGVKGTIGNDADASGAFDAMGGTHVTCPVNEFVEDDQNRVLSTPAYMLAQSVSDAASGIEPLVARLVAMTH